MYTHSTPLRVKKYLNNTIEHDHRFIKKHSRNMLGFKSLQTARKMIAGIAAVHMIKKGQTGLTIHAPNPARIQVAVRKDLSLNIERVPFV